MDTSDQLMQILKGIAAQTPIILVALGGLILIMPRWGLLRGAAVPAMLGFLGLLALSVIMPVFWVLVPPRIIESMDPDRFDIVFLVLRVLSNLFWAAATGLIVLAVFLGRAERDEPLT